MAISKTLVLCLVLAYYIIYVKAQQRCNPPRPTPPSFWRNDTNCQNGPTYKAQHGGQTFNCHCWGHCGYICDVWNGGGGGGGSTRRPTTRNPQGCRHPAPVAPTFWRADQGCQEGPTYRATHGSLSFHCHCWGHCGYFCDKRNGGGGGGRTTTGSPATTRRQSPCPFGGVWFPPNKNLRCRCQSFNQQPYYLCVPIDSSTTAGTGSTAAGTGSTSGGTGATSGATSDTTTGGTGATSGATSDTTTGGTGATSGATSDTTTGGTGATSGATSDTTTGATSDTTTGATSDTTTGATSDTTTGATSDTTTGPTTTPPAGG